MYCIVLYWVRWLKFARPPGWCYRGRHPGPRRGRCGAGHRRSACGSLSMSALVIGRCGAGHRRFEYKVDFFCFQCQAWWVKKFESHPASWVNFSCSACRPQKSIAQLQVRTPGERSKERVFRHKACGSCPKCLADRAWREECDMRDADIESKVQHEYDDMLQQYSPQKRRRIEHRLHKFLIDERNAERSGGA